MNRLPPYVLFGFAAVCALFSLAVWYAFLRPVEQKSARGVVTGKRFKPAGEYVQYPGGARDGFYPPNRIPIAECYVLTIHVDELHADLGYAVNTLAAEVYQVGEAVNVQYVERSLPLVWRRIYLTQVTR